MPKFLMAFLALIVVGCNHSPRLFDKVQASPLDGSVDNVVIFLKKRYLRDPDSYKSVEWGELKKNADGTFQVYHRFSAKNGFGAYDTQTVLFCISEDGTDVHVCEEEDLRRIQQAEEESVRSAATREYLKKDFENIIFSGIFVERIQGLNESFTFRVLLTKNDRVLNGTGTLIEKQEEVNVRGEILQADQVRISLVNKLTGIKVEFDGQIENGLISAVSTDQSKTFEISQIR